MINLLQFIFGRPASGKTYTIIEKIKALVNAEKKIVLIVPEQFTFETEREVLRNLGDNKASYVEVLSFTRLCEEVGRITGGIAGRVLNDCDKVIFMKQALNLVCNDLKLWKSYANSVSFAKTALDIIGEFKINAISFSQLREYAKNIENKTLSSKLEDIALIYENYDALLTEKFIDPTDKLTKLYNSLSECDFFVEKEVFFDSFKGFTGQQYKIIDRILQKSQNVYFSFTNDTENTREYNVYTNIRKAVEKISNIAAKYKIEISNPVILPESNFIKEGLLNLESIISGRDADCTIEDDSVKICCAATIADEAEFAARTIRRLVRTENYRYRDFVIIVRDEDKYRNQVAFACKKNDINCFYDNKVPLSAFPLAVAVEAAIGAISLSTEKILQFHKTGLGVLNTDEISSLENYALLWNIDGALWLKEWDMNPNGLTDYEENSEEIEEFLKYINLLRTKAINPIIEFKNNFHGNATELATAVFTLIKKCNMGEKLALMSETFSTYNNSYNADVLRLSYEEYIKILDSIVSSYGVRNITKEEFVDTLKLAVTLASVGVIAQTLDQVTFGTADRIRPSRPKVAFILGANQGVFPKAIQNSGIFNINERRDLIENGMEIADNSIYSVIEEEYLVYCNLCCPSEKLYVSFSQQSISGQALEPANFVNTILQNNNNEIIREPALELSNSNLPESASSALSEYSRRYFESGEAAIIKKALAETTVCEDVKSIDNFANNKQKTLSENTAKELFGNKIRMSASKFDTYNRCHFSFFCRYGVSAKKLQPADLDVMQRGTIVHYVLERFINDYKDTLSVELISELDGITEKYITEYFDSVKGFKSVNNSRLLFLISRITRSMKEVVRHIALELLQSEFKPVACELRIGENNSLSFPFTNGNITINGSIDRVDEYNGYIRIIDYKTGSKSFKLPDILFGLNMQMLIYLYAVTRAKNIDDEKAAGILYQPSKRDINDTGLAMNGLLQSNASLVGAMDKSGTGEFVPRLLLNNDGSVSKRSNSFIEPQKFTEIFDYIEKLMKKTGDSISSGDIAVSPLDGRESPACKYCDYFAICGIENAEIAKVPDLKNDEVFDQMKGDINDGI